MEHPWFQRLRRIQQLGLGSLIYPGAIHTRFQHALGAMHLMGKALAVLRSKGHAITAIEEEAALAAILLHDIGHGPFSHALEKTLVRNLHHEKLGLAMFDALVEELGEPLGEARAIFTGQHPKAFLHELVSSQLDVDRLDYLTRDTYFTGVHEGVIGTNRILDMLNLDAEGHLVVEAKGIYSIEKFLVARRIMYWQVYLHKAVLSAEQMLIRALLRARELVAGSGQLFGTPALLSMLSAQQVPSQPDRAFLERFASLDDTDIWSALKVWSAHPDPVLSRLASGIVQRRLFRVEMSTEPFAPGHVASLREAVCRQYGTDHAASDYLLIEDRIGTSAYSPDSRGIRILNKDGSLQDLSEAGQALQIRFVGDPEVKHYLCYPKELSGIRNS